MLALGIILVLVAASAIVAALMGGSNDPAAFDLGLFTVETTILGVFLIGAATVLIFVTGVKMTRSGLRSANRRRKEKKEYSKLSERYSSESEAGGGAKQKDAPPDPG